MQTWRRPSPGQYDPYFQQYLDNVPADVTDIIGHLKRQGIVVLDLLRSLDEEQAASRYAAGKWSVKEVVGHLVDTERLFGFRGLWIARGASGEQPGMDENAWASASGAHDRTLVALRKEQHVCRTDHLYLWRSFTPAMREKTGACNGVRATAGVMPWLVAGHERHHLDVLRDRYGLALPE